MKIQQVTHRQKSADHDRFKAPITKSADHDRKNEDTGKTEDTVHSQKQTGLKPCFKQVLKLSAAGKQSALLQYHSRGPADCTERSAVVGNGGAAASGVENNAFVVQRGWLQPARITAAIFNPSNPPT